MHICMITSSPFPPREGMGFYIWNLSRYLHGQGHQIEIITRGGAKWISSEMIDGIRVWRPLFLPIYPFHVHLHSSAVKYLTGWLDHQIDLYHLHTPLVKAPRTKRPILVTAHTAMKADAASVPPDSLLGLFIKLQSPISISLEQELYHSADQIVAVARSIAQELGDYGLNPADVPVLGNGVNAAQFSPNGSKRGEYFLTVGRLGPRKGLEDLVNCAFIVVKTYPDVRFWIAGTGPLEAKLRYQITRLGLKDNVILLGHIADRDRLVHLYRHAIAYLQPSHYEGLPTVLLEAMACGAPVISTAVSGALDVIVNGENGLLVPAHDPVAMSEAAVQLMTSKELAQNLGESARRTIVDRYSWDVVGKNYLAEYHRLLRSI